MSKNKMPWQVAKILDVVEELKRTKETSASMGERIAACFVLGRMDFLPILYNDPLDAWQRLDVDWQSYTIDARLAYREQ